MFSQINPALALRGANVAVLLLYERNPSWGYHTFGSQGTDARFGDLVHWG